MLIKYVELYLKNIKKLFINNCKVIYRIPLIPEYTVTEVNIEKLLKFLKEYKPLKVEIFKIHRLGEKKYRTLGSKMPEFENITDTEIKAIKENIEKIDIEVKYCKI